MGIPFYYKHLIEKYPNIKQSPTHCDIFCIDYNGLIHPEAHSTVCHTGDENQLFISLLKNNKTSY